MIWTEKTSNQMEWMRRLLTFNVIDPEGANSFILVAKECAQYWLTA